jgi:hypothetical protein
MDLAGLFGQNFASVADPVFLHQKVQPQEVVDILTIEYSIDYDITEADVAIRLKLASVSTTALERKLRHARRDLEEATKVVTIGYLERQVEELERELVEINQVKTLEKYTEETADLLEEYQSLPETRATVDLMNVEECQLTVGQKLRKDLIDRYLAIAGKYMEIRLKKPVAVKKTTRRACSSCLKPILTPVYDARGHLICPCGADNRMERMEVASGKEYEVRKNLIKSVKRDACVQTFSPKVMDILLEKLDTYFQGQDLPTSDYYTKLPLNKYGRKNGTDQDTIINAMEALGYNAYYKDYMYICCRFYGWKRMDVLKYLDKIEELFEAVKYVWDNCMTDTEKGRKSSWPVEFLKYKLYELIYHIYGEPLCRREHFDMPKKISSIRRYDQSWKIACNRCTHPEVKYYPTE